MSIGTLYVHFSEGDGPFTRTVLPAHLVEYYKIDSIKVASGGDEYFPAKFPVHKVPGFRFSNGLQLMESIPIALLIVDQIPNNGGLYGKGTAAERAQILQWMNLFNFEFMEPITVPFKMTVGRLPFDKKEWDENWAKALRHLGVIEAHLAKNTYLVGETVTLADLYSACFFLRPVVRLFDKEFRAKYPASIRWFETIKNHPVFNGFFDSVEYLDHLKLPEH